MNVGIIDFAGATLGDMSTPVDWDCIESYLSPERILGVYSDDIPSIGVN
jgi:hypothetical protein